MELHDLPPARDPKGGSPKSPSPIPVREYTETVESNGSKLSAVIIGVLSGALLGALGMWFTAMEQRGVTWKEMEDYVDKHSPYAGDKTEISSHQSRQDQDIGELRQGDKDIVHRLEKIEAERDGINHP